MFGILAADRKPARVVGCEIQDLRDLMAFNNPQELLAIEEVYRQRQGRIAVEAHPPVRGTLADLERPDWRRRERLQLRVHSSFASLRMTNKVHHTTFLASLDSLEHGKLPGQIVVAMLHR